MFCYHHKRGKEKGVFLEAPPVSKAHVFFSSLELRLLKERESVTRGISKPFGFSICMI